MSTEALVTAGLEESPPDGPLQPRKMRSNTTLFVVMGIGFVAILVGLTVGVLWNSVLSGIVLQQLILSPTSTSYSMWKETPIDMYLKIYLYNWTNPEHFTTSSDVKPNFIEMGPYVFKEVDYKVNKVWNKNNGTVTFQQRRVWHFVEEMSNGKLSDQITNLNPVATTLVYMTRYKGNFTKLAINSVMKFTGEKLTVTKTVRELLFDGYEDKLLAAAARFNISGIPYDKFGWFYHRNTSDSYDGTFNINTGINNIDELGNLNEWNYSNKSKYYKSTCGTIGGTLGDLWPPIGDTKSVSVFAPDVCTSLKLAYNGTMDYLGITGSHYVSTRDMLDNGTNVKSRACYCKDVECQPSGAFNVSLCKFGAPAFVSLPHFYLADESYRSEITGMKPRKEEHEFSMLVEPQAGIPMQVRAKLQLNFLVQPDPMIKVFKNVPKTYIPMLWFKQEANLSSSLGNQVKFVLILPILGLATFYGVALIGFLLVAITAGLYLRRYRKSEDNQNLISRTAGGGANRADG